MPPSSSQVCHRQCAYSALQVEGSPSPSSRHATAIPTLSDKGVPRAPVMAKPWKSTDDALQYHLRQPDTVGDD
jgi:hypothetical protein